MINKKYRRNFSFFGFEGGNLLANHHSLYKLLKFLWLCRNNILNHIWFNKFSKNFITLLYIPYYTSFFHFRSVVCSIWRRFTSGSRVTTSSLSVLLRLIDCGWHEALKSELFFVFASISSFCFFFCFSRYRLKQL